MTSDDPSNDVNLCDSLCDLPLTVEDVALTPYEIEAAGRMHRRTVISLHGAGAVGFGEDVTPSVSEHDWLDDIRPDLPRGTYTVGEFSDALEGVPLRLAPPKREVSRAYRRWAIESAALDLALEQADETLATILGRTYDPVEFVASFGLDGSQGIEPLRRWLGLNPDLEFKLDVSADWTEPLLSELAATGAVRVLDLKGQYEMDVGTPADPDLYRRLFETFPDAIVEDPAVTDETVDVLERYVDRISWDAPITGVESVERLPWEPKILNVKPCRFGTVESLFAFLEHVLERGIELYGGGMFELDAGRAHSQALASLFYPKAPNDIAPPAYHAFEPGQSLPTGPLYPPEEPAGIGWIDRTSLSGADPDERR